jgi:hypothetical protein
MAMAALGEEMVNRRTVSVSCRRSAACYGDKGSIQISCAYYCTLMPTAVTTEYPNFRSHDHTSALCQKGVKQQWEGGDKVSAQASVHPYLVNEGVGWRTFLVANQVVF